MDALIDVVFTFQSKDDRIALAQFSELWLPMKNLAVVIALPQDESLMSHYR